MSSSAICRPELTLPRRIDGGDVRARGRRWARRVRWSAAERPVWPSWPAVPTPGPRRLANRFRWGREPARWPTQRPSRPRPARSGSASAERRPVRCWPRSTRWSVGCSARNAPSCRCLPTRVRATGLRRTAYILAFGLAKAATNYLAGIWSDRYGRKPVLVAGWILAVPVPLLLIWAPSWAWVVVANVLLGVSQGLTWSTTVIMKIDLVGPSHRGLAMGLNEAAGYRGRGDCAGHRVRGRLPTGCDRHRSFSASHSPRSAWAFPRSRCTRPRARRLEAATHVASTSSRDQISPRTS